MGDEGEFWNDVKEARRKEKQERDSRVKPKIDEFFQQLKRQGHDVRDLNGGYQYRIDGWLDLFPTGMCYHDIKSNKRGMYRGFEGAMALIKKK